MRDIKEFPQGESPLYDICIIGTGPAGIVVCAELLSANLRICMLESGDLQKTVRGNQLRTVVSAGIAIKEYSRERLIGGTSATWAGLSAPLDEIDMSHRSFLKVPGWPISRNELVPYWEQAALRYRFPTQHTYVEFASVKQSDAFQPSWQQLHEKIFLAAAKPQRFGTEYRHILNHKDVEVLYNATVVGLEGKGAEVTHAKVFSSTQDIYHIRARAFVVATGGIENARLLLASANICNKGLGNEHDQVGRYFLNHPKNNYGVIALTQAVSDVPYFFGCLRNGYAGYAGLRINEEIQHRLGLMNSYVRFEPLFPWSGRQGVEVVIFLVKNMQGLLHSWMRMKRGTVAIRSYAETGDDSALQNNEKSMRDWFRLAFFVIKDFPAVMWYCYYRIFSHKAPPIKKIQLRNFMEMEPDPDNRVTLSEKIDIHGQRIPHVSHVPTERDRTSVIALHDYIAKELTLSGIGRLESDLVNEKSWPIDQDASHHLGTTRMGDDPRTSVVDRNLKLHAIKNVYCAGGSVFSTGGCANPTFTICALSIRLAEHLKKILSE